MHSCCRITTLGFKTQMILKVKIFKYFKFKGRALWDSRTFTCRAIALHLHLCREEWTRRKRASKMEHNVQTHPKPQLRSLISTELRYNNEKRLFASSVPKTNKNKQIITINKQNSHRRIGFTIHFLSFLKTLLDGGQSLLTGLFFFHWQ